ncbi:MAG TPA: erythromycin esterase family protein [Terriglobia bacterium]|nr:erythromycin esterase family protein [Terriglobia bacterium]
MRVLRIRSNYLVLPLLACPIALYGQNAPTQAFQQWARQNVHTVVSVDQDAHSDADLQPLRNIIGTAHVVALGEPFHGGHEPMAMRNRLVRYAVTQLGFTAVALETSLSTSKRMYDHVLGRTTETDHALRDAFSYGFGNYPENLELIQWLRSYNAAQPPAGQVRLYGFDLTGQYDPNAYLSVETVLTFLDHADPGLSREVRKHWADVIPVFRTDQYAKLTPPEKDALTGRVQDMVSLIRRERIPLTAATSVDEYDWGLHQALNAAQDDAFLRSLPVEFDWQRSSESPQEMQPDERWVHRQEMRELAMADNLEWIEQRESSRHGKILFFAHDLHVQTSVVRLGSPSRPFHPLPLEPPATSVRWRPAGMYLRSALDRDMVVIGTYFGSGAAGFPAERAPFPPDTSGMDSLLSSLSIPLFVLDLRELPRAGALHEWFQAGHETRSLSFGRMSATVAPLSSYDAILFIDTITPSPAPQRQ